MKLTMNAKTVNPTEYKAWVVNRETNEVGTIEVQAFSVKEATDMVRAVGTVDDEGNAIPDAKGTFKIRVCTEAEKFEKACEDWLTRLEANKVKNNARNIGRAKDIIDILSSHKVPSESVDKVLEIAGLIQFKEYLD